MIKGNIIFEILLHVLEVLGLAISICRVFICWMNIVDAEPPFTPYIKISRLSRYEQILKIPYLDGWEHWQLWSEVQRIVQHNPLLELCLDLTSQLLLEG